MRLDDFGRGIWCNMRLLKTDFQAVRDRAYEPVLLIIIFFKVTQLICPSSSLLSELNSE